MKRPITPNGYDALRRELQRLRAERPVIAKAIEVAREHGDLSENGDYHAAKERSGLIEAKIRDLESKLALAEVIDPRRIENPQKVVFGVSVEITDVDSGEAKKLSIVGADESDVDKAMISLESPLGRALIGKQVGDIAKVKLPNGMREFEVQRIFVDYQADQTNLS
jgi:transcription elongation factor GreA